MELVDLGLTLGIQTAECELADMDATATEVLLTQQLGVELILPLTDAGLYGTQQELLCGMFRHLVRASGIFHHHDPGYSQNTCQV